jgi:hypothetical protein
MDEILIRLRSRLRFFDKLFTFIVALRVFVAYVACVMAEDSCLDRESCEDVRAPDQELGLCAHHYFVAIEVVILNSRIVLQVLRKGSVPYYLRFRCW